MTITELQALLAGRSIHVMLASAGWMVTIFGGPKTVDGLGEGLTLEDAVRAAFEDFENRRAA